MASLGITVVVEWMMEYNYRNTYLIANIHTWTHSKHETLSSSSSGDVYGQPICIVAVKDKLDWPLNSVGQLSCPLTLLPALWPVWSVSQQLNITSYPSLGTAHNHLTGPCLGVWACCQFPVWCEKVKGTCEDWGQSILTRKNYAVCMSVLKWCTSCIPS